LLSGDHAAVDRWRRKEMLRRTQAERPDLSAAHTPSADDRALLAELSAERGIEPAPIYVGLVHHPIRDREGQIVATAVTNLDVHDLARSCRSYGLRGYFVITPIEAQRGLVLKILEHWVTGSGKKRVPERAVALSLCEPIETIEAASQAIAARHGTAPRVVVTAAKLPNGSAPIAPRALRDEMRTSGRPWLILFGTGHGLAPEVLNSAEF
jgi:tRNA (guanine37-N1)-methyltransferase